jgi:hypothetical protein
MWQFVQMLAGVLLALFTLPLLRANRYFSERSKFTLMLLLFQGIYVGIAVWTRQRVGPEMWGLLLYGNIAVLGYGSSLLVLALGMVGHVVWDILHETGHLTTVVSRWYYYLCMGYNLALGTYVFGRWRHYRKEMKETRRNAVVALQHSQTE